MSLVHQRIADPIFGEAPAYRLRGHHYGRRHCVYGRYQFGNHLPLAIVTGVEHEPHAAPANVLHFGQTGHKNIRYSERLHQISSHAPTSRDNRLKADRVGGASGANHRYPAPSIDAFRSVNAGGLLMHQLRPDLSRIFISPDEAA